MHHKLGGEEASEIFQTVSPCAVRMKLSSRTRQCIWLQKRQKDEGEWKKVEVLITEGSKRQVEHMYIGVQVNCSHLRASNKHS